MRISDWSSDVCSSDLRPDVDPEDYAVSRGLFLIFDMGRHSGLSRRIVILQPVVGVLRIGFVLQQKSQCDGGVLVAERVLRSSLAALGFPDRKSTRLTSSP